MAEPLRLLLIEDNPGDARLLVEMLRDEAHSAFTCAIAGTLSEGLAHLERDACDAVLLDLSLPDSHGLGTFQALHDAWPDVPCVVLTGLADETMAVRAVQEGAQDYLVKGEVSGGLLARSIRYAVERQRTSHYAALMVERERFDTAVSQMSDGIVVTDGDWRITVANRAAQLLLNLPPEPTGNSLPAALGPFALSLPLPAIVGTCDRFTSFEITREHTRPPLYIDGRLTRLADPSGRMVSAVLTLRDVTAERRERIAQVNFLNLMSHKLRTPLTVLHGYLDIIHSVPTERWSDDAREMVAVCRRELAGLTETVRKLLDFKRLEHAEAAAADCGEVYHTDLQALIEEVSESLVQRYAERSITLETQFDAPLAAVDAPPEHCRFVIEQLLDNAAKFGDKPTTTIAVDGALSEGGEVLVTVRDNGPGIPHEYLDRVFEGFVQIEDISTGQIPGLGVGLRLARNVVAAHGGRLEVRSAIGAGTAVCFALPAAETNGSA